MVPHRVGNRALITVAAVVVVIGLLTLYYFVDPGQSAFMPRCWFRYFTGYDCPGCGSQRMVHALLHGDLAGAWESNALLLLLSPVLLFMLWLETQRKRRPRLYMRFYSVATTIAFALLLIGWAILRNII